MYSCTRPPTAAQRIARDYVCWDEKRRGRKKGARFEEASLRGMGYVYACGTRHAWYTRVCRSACVSLPSRNV